MTRESPRRLALAAAAGLGIGVVIGFLLAHLVTMPSPPGCQCRDGTSSRSDCCAGRTAAILCVACARRHRARRSTRGRQAGDIDRGGIDDSACCQDAAAHSRSERSGHASRAASAGARCAPCRRTRAHLDAFEPLCGAVDGGRCTRARLHRELPLRSGPYRAARPPLPRTRGSPETPRVGVILGAFDERNDAMVALDSLPENLKQFRPYLRTLDAVREDALRPSTSSPNSRLFAPQIRPENGGFHLRFPPENDIKKPTRASVHKTNTTDIPACGF